MERAARIEHEDLQPESRQRCWIGLMQLVDIADSSVLASALADMIKVIAIEGDVKI